MFRKKYNNMLLKIKDKLATFGNFSKFSWTFQCMYWMFLMFHSNKSTRATLSPGGFLWHNEEFLMDSMFHLRCIILNWIKWISKIEGEFWNYNLLLFWLWLFWSKCLVHEVRRKCLWFFEYFGLIQPTWVYLYM